MPIVNLVGDHATYHVKNNAPLTSNIEGIAIPVSDWVKTSKTALDVARDGAEAVSQARLGAGRISTLILPADTAWGAAGQDAEPLKIVDRSHVSNDIVRKTAAVLASEG